MKRRKPFLLGAVIGLWGALGGALAACSPLEGLNTLLLRERAQVTRGVDYGEHQRQRLDIYRPAAEDALADNAEAGAPVVVFFYGGSWKEGERGHYRFVGEALARRGLVAVLPDYRLYPDVAFPAFVADGAAALAWVQRNIAAHGGDPRRIVVAGHSAGGHIAALLALDPRYLAAEGSTPESLAGLVSISGPVAFDPLAYDSVRPVFLEAEEPANARPITFAPQALENGAPPALLMHGRDDDTVYPENSERLARALQDAGAEAELTLYPGVGHITILLSFYPLLERLAPVAEATADWSLARSAVAPDKAALAETPAPRGGE